MTDFRALCAELLQECQYLHDNNCCNKALWDRAHAALARPEPQGPTDEELLRIYRVATPCYQVEEYKRELAFARAVLARYGRPAIEPVPVSERLPGPEDCDAQGRCWFFHTSTIGDNEWFLNQLPKVSEWYRWQSITHWLPHWALPVPGVEGADA